MNKIIFIIIDGLAARVAENTLGYLFALVEAKRGRYRRITCELPSMSRPLYETLLTGKAPVESGIVDNAVVRLSTGDNIFALARSHGLSTAAVAYHWVSELYQSCPYDFYADRIQLQTDKPIEHGIFYHHDYYPDMSVLQDAEYLRQQFAPDFLLIHTMNVDDTGHKFGVDSKEYSLAARNIDRLIACRLEHWLAAGYQVVITADHGMAWDHAHSGTTDDERLVPLFTIGDGFSVQPLPEFSQTQICAMLCEGLGIEHPLGNAPDDVWHSC